MNWKLLLGILLAFAIGFSAIIYLQGNMPTLINNFTHNIQLVITQIQGIFSPIVQQWNMLPATVKGILIAGIPTAFTLFFAWSKTRAMNKLHETEIQATQQINQLSGEALSAQTQASTLSTQLAQAKEQINTLQAGATSTSELTAKLDAKQNEIQRLQNDYNTMERTYQSLINELKQKQVTVVK